jgi:fibronectin type 3 domain-containing protein
MRTTPTLRPGVVSARYLLARFRKEARVVVTLTGQALVQAAASERAVFRDPTALPEARQTHLSHFMYGIEVTEEGGESSALSVPIEIDVVEPPPAAARLKATTAEGEVRLEWESGDPSRAGELYNVYRRLASQEGEPRVPLNILPITERVYLDTTFRYGETYRYSVRALQAPPPPLRESEPGAEVEVLPLDTYAPAAPTGLAATVEGSSIKLYWFPNGEPDLRGYRIYRRSGGEEFVRIGDTGAAETSFADGTAGRGVRYDYTVTAVDGAEPLNESPRSEAQSEALPEEPG